MRPSTLKLISFARRSSEGIALTIFLGLILRFLVLTSYFVPNALMAPNLLPGDYILAYKLPYGLRLPMAGKVGSKMPSRGDLVVHFCKSEAGGLCVRRVVGLPGDRIEMRGGRLILNGEMANYRKAGASDIGVALVESSSFFRHKIIISKDEGRSRFGPVIVAPGQVFVLSDHRGLGRDSRDFGGVKVEHVEARVLSVWLSKFWPEESNAGFLGVRWDRVFYSPD